MEIIVKASHIEESLVPQLMTVIEENKWLFEGEKIVLMADAHIGKVVPIGYTQTVTNKDAWISPVFVSADIGCGVTSYLFKASITREQLEAINHFIQVNIKVHRNDHNDSFGTLGGGNHFIEIGQNEDEILLSVHSGSRSYGGFVHKKYEQEGKHAEMNNQLQVLVRQLKEEGRYKEIQEAIEKFRQEFRPLTIPVVKGWDGYFQEMKTAVEWARQSRRVMLDKITQYMKSIIDLEFIREIESIHNYVDFSNEFPIIRKGSIDAKFGSEVVIPLNMRDGIIVGTSSVTDEVNFSLPHGAGRTKSRRRAFEELDFNEFENTMKDVVSTSVVPQTLDESPDAYKSAETILADIKPYLSSYKIYRSILNFKGI